jgi:hypothetical protein
MRLSHATDGKFHPLLICVCLGIFYLPVFGMSAASDFASDMYGSLAAVLMVQMDRPLVRLFITGAALS